MDRVLITGAAGALGRSVVARFAAASASVLAVDTDAAALERLATDLPHAEILCRRADLTSSAEAEELFTTAPLGAKPTVVHLVGGFRFASLGECSDADWRFLIDLNLETTFRVMRHCARLFASGAGGSLVAVGSPAGRLATQGMGPYGAVKAGVLRLTEALAREVAPTGGRANAVMPGTMDTPANRKAMPEVEPATWVTTEQVAEVIHFLCTEGGRAVNGSAVEVPGPTLI